MNTHVEDTVRDVLVDRADAIVPPTGWDMQVLRAARKRQRNRRATVGAAALTVATVVALGMSGVLPSGLTSPFDLAGQPSVPDVPRVAPSDLPLGHAPTIPYVLGGLDLPPGDTVVLPSGSWRPGGFVRKLEMAGSGVVADIANDGDRLVYRRADGHEVTLDRGEINGVAVSADGTKVAWSTTPGNGRPSRLHLASLPDGKVIASTSVNRPGVRHYAGVWAFVGDRVVLDFDLPLKRSPYAVAWDPSTGRIGPLLAPAYTGTGGAVIGADPGAEAVYLLDSDSCLHDVSLAHPTRDRWKSCAGRMKMARLSSDGENVAGFDKNGDGMNEVWVRNASNGQVLAKREFSDVYLSSIVWESPTTVLLSYGDIAADGNLGATGKLLRCSTNLRTCTRVPVPSGREIGALASREGGDPDTDSYPLN